jgi:hypothetical protein
MAGSRSFAAGMQQIRGKYVTKLSNINSAIRK